MTRRPDPLRLYAARRAGLVSRLVMESRLSQEGAERWVGAWESEARQRKLDARTPGWWEPAWTWIAERRAQARQSI